MKITKDQAKDILFRTLKTFLAAFIAALIVSADSFFGISDIEGLKEFFYSALVSAVAAGITAILNVVIKLVKNYIDDRNITYDEIKEAFGGVDDVG